MLNKAIIMGRLTRDPEVRTTGTGISVCSFTVAVDSGYGDNRQADFINCVAWRSQAEFLGKYFKKGMMVIVVGRISTRSWEGQDGQRRTTTEVIASEISFGETKKSREENGGYSAPQAEYSNSYSRPSYGQQTASQQSTSEPPKPNVPEDLNDDDFKAIAELDDDLPF